ncbi:trehalose-phosphatase [compost metagenome]|uniref:Trehalose 6-phosphate phosphatase n=1 Tax=Pseudomonas jinjuensis TaxID=198616 RepID=A0A1H0R2C2_9PSED|nr:trehalose-phosphatase [Pseudomonas jinjuensis]SDP23289.1 trehalose 6-phosphate phosphatase [Pseudomonas jinjuensis]
MRSSIAQGQVDTATALRCDASASALLEDWLSEHSQACALFLDVDGTLLDIADTPDAVQVPRELSAALEILHQRLGGALALVSGRPVDDLDRLFSPLLLPACGCHGAHWRARADAMLREETEAVIDAALRGRLHALARAHPGVLTEDKGSSFALHYRAAPDAGDSLAAALGSLLGEPGNAGLHLLPGKMVFEVIAHGCDKALAIRRFLGITPFAGRRPLFIGDDLTDEPAVALMPAIGGLGLSVGRLLPGARAAFADAAAVRSALIHLAGGMAR